MRQLMSERLPPATFQLLDQIARLGGECAVPVYVVGGFVRDLLLNIENLDIDVVVEGDGIGFARKLTTLLNAEAVPHPRFGTAVLTLQAGGHLDVATARRETYREPGALPDVQPGTIEDDMARRDFSVNSLAIRLTPEGAWTLLNLNEGVRDLDGKRIRILHEKSFLDDPTRIFRAIRFEQRLAFPMEANTERQCIQAVQGGFIGRLSGHRIFNELTAIFSESGFLKCLRRMQELAVFQAIDRGWVPEDKDFELLDRLHRLWREPEFSSAAEGEGRNRILLLGLLGALKEEGVARVLDRLGPPGKFKEDLVRDRLQSHRILQILSGGTVVSDWEVYRLLENGSPEAACWASAVGEDDGVLHTVLRFYRELRPAGALALKGEDLIRIGLKPGPLFQKVFDALLRARLEGRVGNREQEEALVRDEFLITGRPQE